MSINLFEEIKELQSLGLLDELLKDKTTGRNIIWATDEYSGYGVNYSKDKEIQPLFISNNEVIQNRFSKKQTDQQNRTKHNAEVFTPLWVCNKMNNTLDEDWFGYPNVFNNEIKQTDKITFPENKDWTDYINSKRLEITCGEAPFLVSRYDPETGNLIPIKQRIGLLDRKLRVIAENTNNEEDWIIWVFKAFESIYGYEFQGDNLLIARINLLKTFEENLDNYWSRKPTLEEYQKIIDRIVWNIWQMDGLTGLPPYTEKKEKSVQLSFLTLDSNITKIDNNQQLKTNPCVLYDWQNHQKFNYNELRGINEI